LRPFAYYITKGDVKKTSKDANLATSLRAQAGRRFNYIQKIGITDENRDFILEEYYEAVRTLAEAVLASEGLQKKSLSRNI
jgi:hypothetical protein